MRASTGRYGTGDAALVGSNDGGGKLDGSAPDNPAKLVGRQVTIVLSPLPTQKRQLKFSLPEDDFEDVEDED